MTSEADHRRQMDDSPSVDVTELDEEIERTPYRIPLPPGAYAVTLHFAEIYAGATKRRFFDIVLEGQTRLDDYEPGAIGIATADQKKFVVEVRDGFLDLDFIARQEFPKISAIAIVPAE